MANYGVEIDHFTVNGKTFFFNKKEASNGHPYLAINALYGENQREQLVLFRDHMVPFWNAFKKSFPEITDIQPGEEAPTRECPVCGAGPSDWFPARTEDYEHWVLLCRNCEEDGDYEVVMVSDENAVKMIEKEE